MASKYGPLYTESRLTAKQYHETELWDESFRLNVCCARAIEEAIRDSPRDDAPLSPDCAKSVLEHYGIKRTMYVLSHSVKELGPQVQASPDIKEWSIGVKTVPDSEYGRYFTVDTALADLEAFIGQTRTAYQSLGLFDHAQCTLGMYDEDVKGKVLVMKPSTLKEECWSQENQLWLATGGFGCDPKGRGRAIFATCLSDGEQTRWNREDFAGVLDERYLPEWAQEKLAALRAPKQEQAAAPAMGGMEMR